MNNQLLNGQRVHCGDVCGIGTVLDPNIKGCGFLALIQLDEAPPVAFNMGENPTAMPIDWCIPMSTEGDYEG